MWDDRVLFIDGESLVIDKPAGLAVHPGPKTPISLEAHLARLRFGFQRCVDDEVEGDQKEDRTEDQQRVRRDLLRARDRFVGAELD